MSPDEFAQAVKAKYPDYANVPNEALVTRMLQKYPEYRSRIEFPTSPEPSPGTGERIPEWRQDLSPVRRAVEEGIGLTGMVGGALPGLFTGNPFGAAAGAGLGYAGANRLVGIGRQLFPIGSIPPPPVSIPQVAGQTIGDVMTGAQAEMLGQTTGNLFGRVGARLRMPGEAASEIERINQFRPAELASAQQEALQRAQAAQQEAGLQQNIAGAARQTAQGAVEALTGKPPMGQVEAGLAAQGSIRESVALWKGRERALFSNIERLAGREQTVAPDRLRAVLDTMREVSQKTGVAAPGALNQMQRALPETVSISTGGGGLYQKWTAEELETVLPNLPADVRDRFIAGGKLTFADARTIEARLGQIAYRNAKPLLTQQQANAATAYDAIRQDLQTWMATADPTLPTALEAAKQEWRVGVNLYNRSVNRTVLSRDFAPERLVDTVFKPGATTATLDYRQVASPEAWVKSQAAFVASLYDRALTPAGTLDLVKFERFLQPYRSSGQLDVILGPEGARRLSSVLESARVSRESAEQVGGLATTLGKRSARIAAESPDLLKVPKAQRPLRLENLIGPTTAGFVPPWIRSSVALLASRPIRAMLGSHYTPEAAAFTARVLGAGIPGRAEEE